MSEAVEDVEEGRAQLRVGRAHLALEAAVEGVEVTVLERDDAILQVELIIQLGGRRRLLPFSPV